MIENIVHSLRMKRENPFCAYLYDLSQLRNHASNLMSSLPERCRLFYAIKANSDKVLLKTLAKVVNGFEVASLGEIEKVRAVDQEIPIIFGGPGKTHEEIEMAIKHGVSLLHVESMQELRLANYLAEKNNAKLSILLRVNLRSSVPNAQLKMAGVPTQFGIDEARISKAISFVKTLPNLELKGFHFHAMSNNIDSKSHAKFVDHCYELAKAWVHEWDLNISYLNVGGGIGINYVDLNDQFDWNDFVVELTKVFEKHKDTKWQTIFECGRYITSACGYYAAEVLDIKENHGQTFCVLRGGSHHLRLPAAWKQNHPFTVVHVKKWPYPFERPEVSYTKITVAGELCTPNDVLARDVFVSNLKAGDILLFSYAGAYGWSISHHDFLSHPHPERVYIEDHLIVEQTLMMKDPIDIR